MDKTSKVKLKDIADKMGISIVSVSNALNGRAGVSPELRNQIQKTAVAMGYQFENIREKQREEKKTVGVLCSKEELQHVEVYYKTDIKLLEKEFNKTGYHVSFDLLDYEEDSTSADYKFFGGKKLRGILVIGTIDNCETERKLRETEIPIIYLYTGKYKSDNNYIAPDYYRGTQTCVQKMIYYGHREIWLLKDPETEGGVLTDIRMGYEKTLDVNGFTEKKEIDISEVEKRLKDKKELPTAFLCENIVLAKKLKHLLQKNYIPDKKVSIMALGLLQDDTDEMISGIYYLQKDVIELCKDALEKKYYNKENGGRVLIVQGNFHAGSTLYKKE